MNRVPKIRFKEFSGEWGEKSLGEISSLITKGTTPKKFEENILSGIRYIKIESLVGNNIDNNKCLFINEEVHRKELKRSILEKNDILFSIAGAIGKNCVVKEENLPANTNQALAIIRVKKEVNHIYISQVLNSNFIFKYINDNLSVGAQPNLNLEQVSKFKFLIPSIPEQEKIADFLSNVDIKIEKLERKKELWEEYKKGMMQKIFSQEIRFKDMNGNEFPRWVEKRLGEITEEKSIRNKFLENNFVLSVNNKKGFIPQAEQFLEREVASQDKSNYKIVLKGEFAYNPSRINVGSIAYLDKYVSGILSPMYVIFSIKDDIEPHYLLEFITTKYFFKQMKVLLAGSVRESLVYKDFCKIKLGIPCFLEQEKIANFLSSIDSKIEITEKELEGMKEFKKGLLQGMFA